MIVIPPGPRLGKTVLTVNDLAKSYGDRTLFTRLSFSLDAGAVVGVVSIGGDRFIGGNSSVYYYVKYPWKNESEIEKVPSPIPPLHTRLFCGLSYMRR